VIGRPHDRRRRWAGVRLVFGLIAAAVALWIAPVPSAWVEREYATTRFLGWQRFITPVGNVVPVALFDVLLVAVTIFVVVRMAMRLRRVERSGGWRGRAHAVRYAALDVAAAAAVLAIWFSLAWGANYLRMPLRERLDFDGTRVTRAAALGMAQTCVRELNRLHPVVSAQPWPALKALPSTLGHAFSDAQRALGQSRVAVAGRPKPTLLQPYFRWAAIDGMTDPFFLEALVNTDALPIEQPFIVAHEWSHLAGYAHEAEANFFGWVVCQRGGPHSRYSGWLSLYWHLAGALPSNDRRAIDETLEDGPRRDLRAIVERYRRSAPRVRLMAWGLYDRFLKANRVPEGVASYSGVVTLVLGTRFSPDWIPASKTAPK
jgi:Protein of unknown function (DUF3810)